MTYQTSPDDDLPGIYLLLAAMVKTARRDAAKAKPEVAQDARLFLQWVEDDLLDLLLPVSP